MLWLVRCFCSSLDFATIRSMASSQDARSSCPFFRIMGYFKRSSRCMAFHLRMGDFSCCRGEKNQIPEGLPVKPLWPKPALVHPVSRPPSHAHHFAVLDSDVQPAAVAAENTCALHPFLRFHVARLVHSGWPFILVGCART